MKTAEDRLTQRLERAFHKHATRLPVRDVHHWRGKRFVTAKRAVVSGFAK